MRALVMIFLLVFGGAMALGGLIVDGKPFESSEERYNAIATATRSSQEAAIRQSLYNNTITPNAVALQVKVTETLSAVQAAETERRIKANTNATLQVQAAEQTVTTAALWAQASTTAEAQRVQASATTQAQKVQAAATAEAQRAQESATAQAKKEQATAFAFSIAVTQTRMAQEAAVNQAHASETARAISLENQAREGKATQAALDAKATMERAAEIPTLTYIAETPQREADARNRQETFENLLAGALMLSIVLLAGGLLYVMLKFARALERPMATPETGSPSGERQAPEPEPGRGIVVLPQRHAGEKEEKRRRAA